MQRLQARPRTGGAGAAATATLCERCQGGEVWSTCAACHRRVCASCSKCWKFCKDCSCAGTGSSRTILPGSVRVPFYSDPLQLHAGIAYVRAAIAAPCWRPVLNCGGLAPTTPEFAGTAAPCTPPLTYHSAMSQPSSPPTPSGPAAAAEAALHAVFTAEYPRVVAAFTSAECRKDNQEIRLRSVPAQAPLLPPQLEFQPELTSLPIVPPSASLVSIAVSTSSLIAPPSASQASQLNRESASLASFAEPTSSLFALPSASLASQLEPDSLASIEASTLSLTALPSASLASQLDRECMRCECRRWHAQGGEVCACCNTVIPKPKWGHRCHTCKASLCSAACKKSYESRGVCHPALPQPTQRAARRAALAAVPRLTAPPGSTQLAVPRDSAAQANDAADLYDAAAALALAVSRPALATAEEIPGGMQPRIVRILVDTLAHFNSAQTRARKHPGVESRQLAVEASRWLWLMPALLLRRSNHNIGDQAMQLPGPFSFQHCVKRRVQLAETAQWDTLLREYLAHVNQVAEDDSFALRPHGPATPEEIDRRVIRHVQRDDVPAAKAELMGETMADLTEQTARQIDELVAIPIPAGEAERLQAELTLGRNLAPVAVVPTIRTITRRLKAIHLRRLAAPGPSGWRNSHVEGFIDSPGGPQQLRLWSELWSKGRVEDEIIEQWTGQIMAPKDCGPKAGTDPAACVRKLRPIALEECLVKFGESACIDECAVEIRRALEPRQVGSGTPDGTVLAIGVLQQWVAAILEGPAASDSADPELILSLDLENAYGKGLRSAFVCGLVHRAPRLASLLSTKWKRGSNAVWQRVRRPGTSVLEWRRSDTSRGGGQGSRLMLVAFAVGLAHTMDRAWDANDVRLPLSPAEALSLPALTAQPRIGYQDDNYIRSNLSSFHAIKQRLCDVLADDGHSLQAAKCQVWLPMFDAYTDEELPPHIQAACCVFPRARGGLLALGGAASGEMETLLGPYGIGMEPVRKRAAKASAFAGAILALASRRTSPHSAHAAWVLATRSCIHAFDYDARLVGAAALQPVVRPVYDKVLLVASTLAEGLDAHAMAQLQLAGAFGGCGMRLTALAPHAHAARWAAHDANAQSLMDICAALGTPFVRHDPSISEAIEGLRAAGVMVRALGGAELAPDAAAAYDSTPWKGDQSASSLVTDRFPDAAESTELASTWCGGGGEEPKRLRIAGGLRNSGRPGSRQVVARIAGVLTRSGRDSVIWRWQGSRNILEHARP